MRPPIRALYIAGLLGLLVPTLGLPARAGAMTPLPREMDAGSRGPWVVSRVLEVPAVASLCASHPSARFIASVRGYLTAFPLNGPGGGWVGRLFEAPNPRAFHAGDTTPFVQVWGTKAWSLNLTGRRVTFHGVLSCDALRFGDDLPGWLGSITPDRYSIAERPAAGPARLTVVVAPSDLGRVGAVRGQVSDVAVDVGGNLFMADNFVGARPVDVRCQVRELVATTGEIRVVAGALPHGSGATPAQRIALSSCGRLAVDAGDHVYLISTRFPYGRYPLRLFRIDAASGAVRVIAGCTRCFGFRPRHPATQSSMEDVNDLAVDRSGNVLLPDAYTGAIWSLTPRGAVRRVAANVCRLRGNLAYVCPDLVAPAAAGTIFFSDSDERVEGLIPATGRVSIVAGGGSCRSHQHAFCGNGIPATKAKLDGPQDIAVDGAGNLLIAGDVVQRVDMKTHMIEILAGNGALPRAAAGLHRGQSWPALTTAIEPRALATGPNGGIFIAEAAAGVVLKLQAAGT